MSHAGWGSVWNLVLALLRAQPVQIQILIGLAVAFLAVMVLEGLRASFLPGYRALPHHPYIRNTVPSAPRKQAGTANTPSAEMRSVTARVPAPFRPREVVRPPFNLKRAKPDVSRHSTERPKIRRDTLGGFADYFSQPYEQDYASQSMVTEEAAPFSQLSPILEQDRV
jgi:hypothetical protein